MICLGQYISNSFQLDKSQRDLLEIHHQLLELELEEEATETIIKPAERIRRSLSSDLLALKLEKSLISKMEELKSLKSNLLKEEEISGEQTSQ